MADEHGIVVRWKSVLQASTDPRLSRADLAVMLGILDRMDGSGRAWPGLSRIAADAKVDRSTAIRAVRKLCELGYLYRESGSRTKSNEYRIGPAGRCEVAPTGGGDLAPSGRCEAAPRVGVSSHPRVGASSHPEPALKNLPIEPAQLNQAQKHCRFADFWTLYPRKDAKAKAQSIWASKKLEAHAEKILADLQARLDDGQWTELRFVPHATTYLNQRRWEDEWASAQSKFQRQGPATQGRPMSRTAQAILALERMKQGARRQMGAVERVEANVLAAQSREAGFDGALDGEFTRFHPAGNG